MEWGRKLCWTSLLRPSSPHPRPAVRAVPPETVCVRACARVPRRRGHSARRVREEPTCGTLGNSREWATVSTVDEAESGACKFIPSARLLLPCPLSGGQHQEALSMRSFPPLRYGLALLLAPTLLTGAAFDAEFQAGSCVFTNDTDFQPGDVGSSARLRPPMNAASCA